MKTLVIALAATTMLAGPALAEGKKIGVSWSNFQEERWKTDEAAMKEAIEAAGDEYVSADAQSSASKQLTDVESLLGQGVDALIILAQDSGAIGPAVQKASDEGVPVVGYDRLIENPDAFYLTFDNKEVGRMQARAVLEAVPEGNYAFIKGSSADPNADFLFSGQMEVLQEAMDSGAIQNVGESYTDAWLPENAQANMEQILTANDNEVDAVVASNDGTAGGAVAALSAQGLDGSVPVSGQDGDHAALNRIARGTQTVSVWKDSRELGKRRGRDRRRARRRHRDGRRRGRDRPGRRRPERNVEMNAIFLAPVPGHQGEPRRGDRRGLGRQGDRVRGREPRTSPPAQ